VRLEFTKIYKNKKMKKVKIAQTRTYLESLIKLKDNSVREAVTKKVLKLLDNPNLAVPMGKQHFGICEIKVTGKYRIYCLRKERAIILFLLGPVINHNKNFGKSKEYKKLFSQLRSLEEDKTSKKLIKELIG